MVTEDTPSVTPGSPAQVTGRFGLVQSAVYGAPHTAEFERALIRHRTDEGRQAAKRRSVSFGRPQKLRPDQKALAVSLVREGRSISEVAKPSTSTPQPSTAALTGLRGQIRPYDSTPSRSDARAWMRSARRHQPGSPSAACVKAPPFANTAIASPSSVGRGGSERMSKAPGS